MRILLVYYTGTYNTRYLSDLVEKRFTSRGDTVDRVEINREAKQIDTEDYDYIGFSYPIYGFNTPLAFDRYTKKMKVKEGQKYFIYKNSGEVLAMNNASSRLLIRAMKRKKAVLCGEYHFVMPYNIHFPFDDDFVRQILEKDSKLLDIMMYNLNNGIVNKIKSKWIYNFAAFFVGIVKVAGNVNSFFYRVDMDKCVKCMKCVNDCPQKNIKLKKGKIKFGHKCDCCMRCSFHCPTAAINIGFLQGWKVNGDYHLKQKASDTTPLKPYITKESQGFYKCFIKYFENIDNEHEKLFGIQEDSIYVTQQEVATTAQE